MTTKWLRKIVKRITGRDVHRERLARKRKPWLFVELLENRIAPAVVTLNVTTTTDEVSDNGQLSLREAIIQANAVPASDDVVINLQNLRYEIGADRDRFQGFAPHGDTENSIYDELFGDFDIRRAMTINGNGAIISAADHGRV